MKLWVLVMSLILLSCSKDSDDPTGDNDDNIKGVKLIKKISYTDNWYGGVSMDFAYQNGKLTKKNNDGELFYFEYGSNGKINLSKECGDQGLRNIDTDNYNCVGFYGGTTFIYENGRLVDFGPVLDSYKMQYDSYGNLISDEGDWASFYYTYDSSGNVKSLQINYNGEGTSTYTFEWDDKINPFNVLWNKFGYFNWHGENFTPYGVVGSFCKNNPTKVFYDGKLSLEASYTYDDQGYPISCYYITGGQNDGSVTFTYAN